MAPGMTGVRTHAPNEHVSRVQLFPSLHSAAVVHATQMFPEALGTQFGVVPEQPRSVPVVTVLMQRSHTGTMPEPLVRQCAAAVVQPASVPVAELSTQSMHVSGAPPQTKPGVQAPAEPEATGVNVHVFVAEQVSVVHALLSLQ